MIFVAYRMLTGDRAKYLGILLGVSLATLLIVHQITIFTGLMARTWSVVRDLRDSSGVEVIVTDAATEFLNDARPMAETDLQRVRSIEGVAWAVPMSFTPVKARMPGGRFRTCIVVGLDDATLIGGPPVFAEGSAADLRKPDAVALDALDAEKLLASVLPDGSRRAPTVGDVIEINDRKAVVTAITRNTRPFLSQPIVYTTRSNAKNWAPPERRNLAYILVKLAPGAERQAVIDAVENDSRGRLTAYATTDFGFKTVGYFIKNTGIPVNFGITIILGCIVGIAISGQTFYLFVLDNLKQLAALKAMGASNLTLIRMTLFQGLMVGTLGYGLGVGGAWLLVEPFFKGTDLQFDMYWQIFALALVAITVIVILACLTSLLRVIRLEPAVVFKG
ncbi:MAG: ABC transporter permease [Phycisphaerales bacterium]